MAKKVLFLTTAHIPLDDRIYYHQAKSLIRHGYEVHIVSTMVNHQSNDTNELVEGIVINNTSFRQKRDFLISKITESQPGIIICSEPMAVIAASAYKKKHDQSVAIVYDITEWYPSKRNIENEKRLKRPFKALALLGLNLWAGYTSDAFMYGEMAKSFPFSQMFPRKMSLLLPYYPSTKFIHWQINKFTPQQISLCYTGRLSEEKGIGNFIRAVDLFHQRNPKIGLTTKIIGKAEDVSEQNYFDNLLVSNNVGKIVLEPRASFLEFTSKLQDVDICFDLRFDDFENTRCLPIKIFYYAACGKPVIYSNLKALRKSVEVSEFGFLVRPNDVETIVGHIEEYCASPELFEKHAANARRLFLEKYNWENLEKAFCTFVDNLKN